MLSSIELKSNVRVRQEAKYRRCIGAVWPLIFLFCSKPQKRLDLRSEHKMPGSCRRGGAHKSHEGGSHWS